jgi:hypothetical protein
MEGSGRLESSLGAGFLLPTYFTLDSYLVAAFCSLMFFVFRRRRFLGICVEEIELCFLRHDPRPAYRTSAVERAGLSTLNEGQNVQYEIVSNRGKESAETSRPEGAVPPAVY